MIANKNLKALCGDGENEPSCRCHSQVCSFPTLLLSPSVDQQDTVRVINSRNLESTQGTDSVPIGAGNCLVKRSNGDVLSLGGTADPASIKIYNKEEMKFEQLFNRLPGKLKLMKSALRSYSDGGRSQFSCSVQSNRIWICGGIRTIGTSYEYLDTCYSTPEDEFEWNQVRVFSDDFLLTETS